MKKLLPIIILGIAALQAHETYPKWEDAKQFKYNKAVVPNNYKDVGLKEKIKEISGEQIKYDISGISPKNLSELLGRGIDLNDSNRYIKKIRSREFKEGGRVYRAIYYDENSAQIEVEKVYFYRDKKDKKAFYDIKREYYKNSSIKEESHTLDGQYRKRDFFYENSKLKMTLDTKSCSNWKYYDKNGTLTKETWSKHVSKNYHDYIEFTKVYNGGVLTLEITKVKERLDGFSRAYDKDGSLKSETFFEDGRLLYTSYCHFNTTPFANSLELKHMKYFAYKRRHNTYCVNIDKDTYFIGTSYVADTYEGERPGHLAVMLSVVDKKRKKIIASYYDENSSMGYEESFSLERFTRKSKTNNNVIDATNLSFYNSYKFVMGKIVPLKKEKIEIKELKKQAKEGKHFTGVELVGVVNEVPITQKNVTAYNDIGYYLQQHGFNDEALVLFKEVLFYFPNREVLLLNIGDSAWELKEPKLVQAAYSKYIKLMKEAKKDSKIPKRVYRRVSNKEIKR